MTKVFVVTEGEYSDCRNVGVFTTREKAEERVQSCRDCPQIEEFILDNNENLPGHLKMMHVIMNREGVALRVSFSGCYGREDGVCYGPISDTIYPSGFGPQHGAYEFHVLALDEKHAIKIANERRTKMLALNLWKPASTEVGYISRREQTVIQ